jgi:hypothetical protein
VGRVAAHNGDSGEQDVIASARGGVVAEPCVRKSGKGGVLKGSREGEGGHGFTYGGLYSTGEANGDGVAATDASNSRAESSVTVAMAEPDAEWRAVATIRRGLIVATIVRRGVSMGVIKDGSAC